MNGVGRERAIEIAGLVEDFVRQQIIPYETDERRDHHGAPTDELVNEMRANMDRQVEWLPANIPVDESEEVSVVHGNFRIDNLIFHPTEPKVLTVLGS